MPTKVERFECKVCHHDGWHTFEEAKKCEDTPVEKQFFQIGEEISWIDTSLQLSAVNDRVPFRCKIVGSRPSKETHKIEYDVLFSMPFPDDNVRNISQKYLIDRKNMNPKEFISKQEMEIVD